MDMKRILQAMDGVATKPVVGASDMAKFLSIVDNDKTQALQEDSPPAMTGGASDSGSKSGKAYEYQMKALQDLLTTESEPWKQHLTKWRIKNLETNGVTAFHTDYNKNAGGVSTPIKVLDSESWLKKNPSLAKQLPPECLPPVPQAAPVQQPGILDKIKKSWNDWEPAYKRDADNLERSREEQGLGNFGGAAGTFIQKESANDMTKFLSIVDKNASIKILHEGKDPHKITLPVQMAMQHYQKEEPVQATQHARVGRESVVRKYFDQAEQAVQEEQIKKKNFYKQYAQTIAERVLMKESKLDERSTTEKQARTMAAAAHNPAFAKKVGIDQKVAKEFNQKDKGTALLSNAMKGKRKKVKELDGHSMGFKPQGPGIQSNAPDGGHLNLSELSTDTLGKYKKAAYADAKKADAEGDYARGDKRFKGINKATVKQFDNDLKKHNQNPIKEANAKKRTLKNSNPCWDGYKPVGTKKKGGRTVPNCVPKE
jgi:hypothetical protein